MDEARTKSPKKQRRWLVVALALFGLLIVIVVLARQTESESWPRGDKRLVGKWSARTEKSVPPTEYTYELRGDGTGSYSQTSANPFTDKDETATAPIWWRTEGDQFVVALTWKNSNAIESMKALREKVNAGNLLRYKVVQATDQQFVLQLERQSGRPFNLEFTRVD